MGKYLVLLMYISSVDGSLYVFSCRSDVVKTPVITACRHEVEQELTDMVSQQHDVKLTIEISTISQPD